MIDDKHICPLSMLKGGEPKKCLKESCSWWMLKDRNCAFVVGARALRNFDEEGISMLTRETRGYFI